MGERLAKEKVAKLKKARLKGFKITIKAKKAEALKAAIERRRLLLALVKDKKPVSVLRRVSDTIPNVLIKTRAEEIKPTFLGKGRI